MKHELENLLRAARDRLAADGRFPADAGVIEVQRTRDASHGEFSCNLAMTLAAAAKMKPRELAGLLVERLPSSPLVDRVEIAGPGFLNFFLKRDAWFAVIPEILARGDAYGRGDPRPVADYVLSPFAQRPTFPATGGRSTGLFSGNNSGFGG